MEEGFILSNKYRRVIFDELTSGETNLDRIAKKHHIVRRVVQRVIDEFMNNGIIEKKENTFILTEKGKKIAQNIG
jgi:predicted transcriptional regulator